MLYMLLYLMLYMLLYMLLYQLLCMLLYLLRYLLLVQSTVRLVLRRRVVQLVITSDQSHAQGSHSIERWSQPKVKQLLHSAELPGRVVTRGSAPFNPSAPIILIFPGGCTQEEIAQVRRFVVLCTIDIHCHGFRHNAKQGSNNGKSP